MFFSWQCLLASSCLCICLMGAPSLMGQKAETTMSNINTSSAVPASATVKFVLNSHVRISDGLLDIEATLASVEGWLLKNEQLVVARKLEGGESSFSDSDSAALAELLGTIWDNDPRLVAVKSDRLASLLRKEWTKAGFGIPEAGEDPIEAAVSFEKSLGEWLSENSSELTPTERSKKIDPNSIIVSIKGGGGLGGSCPEPTPTGTPRRRSEVFLANPSPTRAYLYG
jgi:hypothetical protein